MKTMLTLSELAARLESDKKATADVIAPVSSIKMNEQAALIVPSLQPAELVHTGHRQLGEYVDIPPAYYDRLLSSDKPLLAANVNRWLPQMKNKRGETDRRMVRTLHGKARALLSDRYQRIDNHQVAEVVLNILSRIKGITVRSCAVTDYRMHIKVTSNQVVAPDPGLRRVGSLIEAGVHISNSEIGAGSVNIEPFAFELWCLNGAMRNGTKLRAAHLGRRIDADLEGLLSDETKRLEDAIVMKKIEDVVKFAFDRENFLAYVQGLKDATEQKIVGDVPAAVEVLGQTLSLSIEERSSILTHLIAEGDLSKYGLFNAVTRTAEDVESYDRATEIERLGQNVIELPQSAWREISEARPQRSKKEQRELLAA